MKEIIHIHLAEELDYHKDMIMKVLSKYFKRINENTIEIKKNLFLEIIENKLVIYEEKKESIKERIKNRLKKLFRYDDEHINLADHQYIEILEHIEDATINLFRAEETLRDRITSFCCSKRSMPNESIKVLNELDVIEYRLETPEELIENMKK